MLFSIREHSSYDFRLSPQLTVRNELSRTYIRIISIIINDCWWGWRVYIYWRCNLCLKYQHGNFLPLKSTRKCAEIPSKVDVHGTSFVIKSLLRPNTQKSYRRDVFHTPSFELKMILIAIKNSYCWNIKNMIFIVITTFFSSLNRPFHLEGTTTPVNFGCSRCFNSL